MDSSTFSGTIDGEAMLVNAWVVVDGAQSDFVELINRLFEHLRTRDGFLEGAVLRSANPTRFISYVRMSSALDRQRLFDDAQVAAELRAIAAVAHADLHSYDLLKAFRPADT